MLDRTNSPKLTAASRRASIYPYYAGFSEQFVESILRRIEVSQKDIVLDPWNGSGTTTSVCSRRGIPSIGIDINPAMKPIAAVRSMTAEKIRCVSNHAISTLYASGRSIENTTPFSFCYNVFEIAKENCASDLHDGLRFGFMLACRALARKVRSKNPTWHSLSTLRNLQISTDTIRDEAVASFNALKAWKDADLAICDEILPPDLVVGDWDKLRWRHKPTHIITSPPYLTRIDYVMKTLPELLFLAEKEDINLSTLRRRMLGSVLTKNHKDRKKVLISETARDSILKVKNHDSKASSTYYYRFFHQYLQRIESSLKRFSKPQISPTTITIVSQGSYYKEIFVDLPTIIDDIMIATGYIPYASSKFTGAAHMAMVNRRSKASILPSPPEIAVIYRKA